MKGCYHKLPHSSRKQKTHPANCMCSKEKTIPYVPAYVFVRHSAELFRETRSHFKNLGYNFLGVTAHFQASSPGIFHMHTLYKHCSVYMCVSVYTELKYTLAKINHLPKL